MPLFTLPIADISQTSAATPQVHFAPLSLRPQKRKRRESDTEPIDDYNNDYTANTNSNTGKGKEVENGGPSQPSAEITNPLSLTPAEVMQYRLAGLGLDKELPSKIGVKHWPHRGLPPTYSINSDDHDSATNSRANKEDDSEEESAKSRRERERRKRDERKTGRSNLRIQHLSVLVAIMMRNLEEGDMERAGRAWALLLRMQIAGQGVEIRKTGYWGIGAELLMRGAVNQQRKEWWEADAEEASGDEANIDSDGEPKEDGKKQRAGEEGEEKRYGTAEGLLKVKDYYERLILQYPYKRQFHGSVNALDFWPAMLGCEIYGIQFEHKAGLRKIAKQAEKDEEGDIRDSDISAEEEDIDDEEEGDPGDKAFAAHQRRQDRLHKRRKEKRWEERDEVRRTALVATELVAQRMNELMTTPPYSDSPVLIRLRGMVALYIGDLCVPEKWDGDEEWLAKVRGGAIEADRRFLGRQRDAEVRRGKEKREDERRRARALFGKIGLEWDDGDEGMDLDMTLEGYEGDE
ncbi:794ef326-0840-4ea0-909a-0ca761740bc2-CDS [Sclerotinia trifoliorum]|uniref:794ef326-0840-4ea0-909a-0ca761740bc2-CDS n=1 Tax=Sclerotinia trifoliorum TaxID=28548 RepID=A0A8H2VL67_9HELO|nr:794ef326-0840-4ea0-909a-0ca761740bc2-CDS [Sclerotinia trifoliorum]